MNTADTGQVRHYLGTVLGLEVKITEEQRFDDRLPFYLTSAFVFFEMEMLGRDFVLSCDRGEGKLHPHMIRDHLAAIREKLAIIPIYVHAELHRDARRDLIKFRVPFIIPNKQLYLPDLGIDFREKLVATRPRRKALAPLSQATALYAMLNRSYGTFGNSRLAELMGYSTATASRAISEFCALGLLTCQRRGKEQSCDWVATGRELWNQLLPWLRDPVKNNVFVQDGDDKLAGFPQAGLSALSRYSLIAEPWIQERACSPDDFHELQSLEEVTLGSYPTPEGVKLQVWKYDPNLLARNGVVDPLSLFLNLKDDPDERTQICLEETLEKLGW